jgi:hypothetical protein
VLQLQKIQIRKEVKWQMIAGLDKEELVHLKFSEAEKKSELKWEHSREFEYKGEMYDLVEIELIGDTTYFTLWHDHEETQLNKQLNVLVAKALGNNPTKQENEKKVDDFFKTLYCKSCEIERLPFEINVKVKYNPEESHFQEEMHLPLSPPPEKG